MTRPGTQALPRQAALAGLASSTQYRRSGMPLGTGSSLTGGATTAPDPTPASARRNQHRQP